MDLTLFGILTAFGIVLLFLTFFKKQIIVGVFTGIVFMVLGLFAWAGLEYVSSTTIVENVYGTVTITDNYTPWVHTIGGTSFTYTSVIGTLFILFGLFMLIVSSVMVFTSKSQPLFSESSEGGGDDE